MSIDAVAIFHVPYTRFCEALGKASVPSGGNAEGGPPSGADASEAGRIARYHEALEETFPLVPLGDDGTAVFLGIAFAGEPEELGAFARQALGPALDLHEDARGFLVAPDVGWSADGYPTYEAAIDYFGDAGGWIPTLAEADANAIMKERGAALYGPAFGALDAASAAGFVRAQLFGDGDAVQEAMGKMQSAMADHPELFAAAKQMADQIAQHAPGLDLGSFFGGGDLMQMAERMLGGLSGAEQDRLQKMAANTFEKLGGQEGVDAILNAGTAAGGPTNVKGKK